MRKWKFWTTTLLFPGLFIITGGCAMYETPDNHLSAFMPADSGAGEKTIALYQNLAALRNDYIMIGHQDALSYGIGWNGEHDKSDLKIISGSHPAIYGWDIGGIELGLDNNLDTVPFGSMRQNMFHAFVAGGMNTISWHAYNPVTGNDSWADTDEKNNTVTDILPRGSHHDAFLVYLDRVGVFMNSLRAPDGELIPVVFRPWHEHTGNWFWWGRKHCSTEEYVALFRFTIEYLRAKHNLNNLLVAYSPDIGFQNAEQYLERYPGDDIIDIIGLDDYHSIRSGNPEQLIKNLEIIASIAKEKNKIAAFTETGLDEIPDEFYFTQKLLPCLDHSNLTRSVSWVLLWRNAHPGHHYVPYPGHKAVNDFLKFRDYPLMLMQNDIPSLYEKYPDILKEIKKKQP